MSCVYHRYKPASCEAALPSLFTNHPSNLHSYENSILESLRFVFVDLRAESTEIDDETIVRSLLVALLLFIVCFTGVNAVDLIECGKRLQAAREGSWNATNGTSPAPVLRLSRQECFAECGAGIGDVSWEAFSQSFGAWFLPWIALMFQIPFGAECTSLFGVFRYLSGCSRDASQTPWKTS